MGEYCSKPLRMDTTAKLKCSGLQELRTQLSFYGIEKPPFLRPRPKKSWPGAVTWSIEFASPRFNPRLCKTPTKSIEL